jgi:hypothetical protein
MHRGLSVGMNGISSSTPRQGLFGGQSIAQLRERFMADLAFLPGIPKYSDDLEVMVLQLQNYQVQFT